MIWQRLIWVLSTMLSRACHQLISHIYAYPNLAELGILDIIMFLYLGKLVSIGLLRFCNRKVQ